MTSPTVRSLTTLTWRGQPLGIDFASEAEARRYVANEANANDAKEYGEPVTKHYLTVEVTEDVARSFQAQH